MKIEPFANTPRLDRVPAAERCSVYCATHQRLLREDKSYRQHYNRFVFSIIITAIASVPVGLLGNLLGPVVTTLLPFVPTAVIIWLAFRYQRYMNKRIGDALQTQSR